VRIWSWLLAGLVLVAGCDDKKKSDDDDSDKKGKKTKSGASASASAAGNTGPALGPDGKPLPASVAEAGRRAKCTFAKWEGTGKDRKAMFKMEVPPGKEVDVVQTWLYYYDKSGKGIDRYPHSTSPQAELKALGEEGDDINPATDSVDCEITSIHYKDGTVWFNDNLETASSERPKGGFTDAQLKAMSGRKIQVDVVDGKSGKVKLKNISDKEIKRAEVAVMAYAKEGGHVTWSDYIDLTLKPGETVEKEVNVHQGSAMPDSPKAIDAEAPEVTFADDTEWENKNLDASDRPAGG
jgi:hypothetical protein